MSTNMVPFGWNEASVVPGLSMLPSIFARIVYLFKADKFAEMKAVVLKAELEKQAEIRQALLDSLTRIALSTDDPNERASMFHHIMELGIMWGMNTP